MKIRKAVEKDAPYFIEIKNQLTFQNVEGTTTKGGFLLGTDVEMYKTYIRNEIVLVAENAGKIIGFGIVLKDETVRKTDVWQKRNLVHWQVDIEKYSKQPICYFEQLAFIPGYSRAVIRLCYEIIQIAFQQHAALFTTTVEAPILNLAAVPYILRAGGTKIGVIEESYPIIGNITSSIYMILKKDFEDQILHSNRYKFLYK